MVPSPCYKQARPVSCVHHVSVSEGDFKAVHPLNCGPGHLEVPPANMIYLVNITCAMPLHCGYPGPSVVRSNKSNWSRIGIAATLLLHLPDEDRHRCLT